MFNRVSEVFAGGSQEFLFWSGGILLDNWGGLFFFGGGEGSCNLEVKTKTE